MAPQFTHMATRTSLRVRSTCTRGPTSVQAQSIMAEFTVGPIGIVKVGSATNIGSIAITTASTTIGITAIAANK